MMSVFKRALLIVLVLLLLAVSGMAQAGGARIRFVHVIPGANAIDIYTDGQLTIKNLAYGQATGYVDVTAGSHHLSVTGSGSTSSIWEQDITPNANTSLTLVASSASAAAFSVFQDDLNPLALGKARFTALHAIADGPTVDVLLDDGRPVIPGLAYNQPYGTLDLPAATYALGVVPSGQPLTNALVAAQPFNLASGTSYVLLVYGTSTSPQTILLSAASQAQEAGGYLRVAHALSGGQPVDVYINSTLAVPALAFGDATVFMALPSGTYTVSARASGATTDMVSSTVDVATDGYQSAIISGSAAAPSIQIFSDATSAVNETTAVLAILNTSADVTASAATSNGSALLGPVAAGKSDAAPLPPSDGASVISASTTGSSTADVSGGVYGGVYYSAVVASDGSVFLLPPASLAQGIGSAPGAPPPPTPTLEPTAVPTEAPQPTAVPAIPTEAPANAQPTQASAEVVIQPTAAATAGPSARVLTNSGVNLQLRQYPDRGALSLGLAPSGSTLLVNGRAGAPVPPVGTTATPLPTDATPFVDPATLLQPGTDLDPVDTWVNVTFDTPDGGTITAWVNALYLGIVDGKGRPMALKNLPLVPNNQAGSAQNTSVQPPEATRPVTMVIVTSVDTGVNVHIRRTPDTAAESLALVPAGTQLEFLGVNDARDWVFVRYTSPDGTVTGWLNIQFVTLQRSGQAVDFDRLQALNALTIMTGDERGEVVLSGQPTSAVAPDLRNVVAGQVSGLNSDANLHLRRNPNDQAESLALLPNATNVVVDGRTEDSTWLHVTSQGQTGWVAASYLVLTFNGQPYEVATLPVVDLSPTTPEASPTPQG